MRPNFKSRHYNSIDALGENDKGRYKTNKDSQTNLTSLPLIRRLIPKTWDDPSLELAYVDSSHVPTQYLNASLNKYLSKESLSLVSSGTSRLPVFRTPKI